MTHNDKNDLETIENDPEMKQNGPEMRKIAMTYWKIYFYTNLIELKSTMKNLLLICKFCFSSFFNIS